MNKTKKAFMLAGSIISIVQVLMMVLGGFILMAASSIITEEQLCSVYDTDSSYTKVEEGNGDYYYVYTDQITQEQYLITDTDIQTTVQITKTILNSLAIYVLVMGVANLVFAIIVLKHSINESNKKFGIITLLVLSVLTSNILTTAFMIVALCIKDKPKEVAEQNGEAQV